MATLIIAFNLENIAGLLYNQREMLVTEMQKDDSWKGLGTKLEGSSPNRRTPSEWWLVAYMAHRFVKIIAGKKGRKGDTESHRSESCQRIGSGEIRKRLG